MLSRTDCIALHSASLARRAGDRSRCLIPRAYAGLTANVSAIFLVGMPRPYVAGTRPRRSCEYGAAIRKLLFRHDVLHQQRGLMRLHLGA